MVTCSTSFRGVFAAVLASVATAFIAGCGDDDESGQDAGRTQDSSFADVAIGDDSGLDASFVDANFMNECSEAEEEFAETPLKLGGGTTFYALVDVNVFGCRSSADFDACVVDAVDERSDGVVGARCGICIGRVLLCTATVCTKTCADDPEGDACHDCRCGVSETSESCIEDFETCAGYTPTLCLPEDEI